MRLTGKEFSVSLDAAEIVGACRRWGLVKRAEVDRLVYNPYKLTG